MQDSSSLIKFKSSLSQQKEFYIKKLIKKVSLKVLSDYLSNLSDKTDQILQDSQLPEEGINLYQCIQQWRIVDFYWSLPTSGENLILKSIAQIKFQNLQQIQIFDQDLTNIESIAFLDCPNLKKLCFQSLKPFLIKPLVKTNFKNLLVLQTYQHIAPQNGDIDNLRRFHMPKEMTKLEIFSRFKDYQSLRRRLFVNTYLTKQEVFVSYIKWVGYK